jgi:type II secretory pathway pseudopilin PulG
MKPGTGEGGFTLFEVVLSLLIFGLVAAGVLLGFIQGERIAEIDSHRIAAANIARAKTELLKSMTFNEVTSGTGGYTSDYPYYVGAYSDTGSGDRPMIDSGPTDGPGDDLKGYTYVQVEPVTLSVGTNSFNAKNLTVTVTWTEGDTEIRERVITLLTENTVSGG